MKTLISKIALGLFAVIAAVGLMTTFMAAQNEPVRAASAVDTSYSFPLQSWKNPAGKDAVTFSRYGDITALGALSGAQGYWLPSNSAAAWPLGAKNPGDAFIGVDTNGDVYLLTSTSSSTNWGATTKLGGP